MRNKTFLFLLIVFSVNSFAQEERTTVYGHIKSEGAELENIHILNKNSKEGTITNTQGVFSIEVREKDTLIVTGIQFYYLEIPITPKHLQDKTIAIDLLQKMNELEEVVVKHSLTGNLTVDSDEINIVKNVGDGALNFADIDLSLVGNINDASSRSRTSSDSELVPSMNLNLITVAGLIIDQVKKIGTTKKNIKKYENRYQAKVLQAHENLRTDFGDTFFTETLKIPADHIDEFIASCLPKGIGYLYADDKKIEMIDMFISESKIYLAQIKNEN